MPKRLSKFNLNLQEQFKEDFSIDKTDEHRAICKLCNVSVNLGYTGANALTKHQNAASHQNAVRLAQSTPKISSMFSSRSETDSATTKRAAAELTFAYHSAQHGMSARAVDCQSKLISTMFDSKYTGGKTKNSALVKNVIAPQIRSEMIEDIKKMTFIAVMEDASNHKSTKLIPIIIRGFIPEKGIVVYKLEIADVPNERALTITERVLNCLRKWNATAKVICFVADNCNTNFGGSNRNGQDNVYYHLQTKLNRNLFGIGCEGHVVHNAFDAATDELPIDIEAVVVKLFRFFSIYTVRVENLKAFLEAAGNQYKAMTRHCGTRFLTLLPCIENIIDSHDGLMEYFMSPLGDAAPKTIKDFFRDPDHFFWLQFLGFQMSLSNEYILRIEGKNEASYEVGEWMRELTLKIENRKNLCMIPSKAKVHLNAAPDDKKRALVKYVKLFYKTLSNYFTTWKNNLDGTEIFKCMNLQEFPESEKAIEITEFAITRLGDTVESQINIDLLADELTLIKDFVQSRLQYWNEKKISPSERWVEVFTHCKSRACEIKVPNLSKLVELVHCIPGTSCEAERVFSIINATWTKQTEQMLLVTLEAIVDVKYNASGETCMDYYKKVLQDKNLLSKVTSSEKYNN